MAGNNTVLVLGATGGIGGELARQLLDAGWDVRALGRRAAGGARRQDGILWMRGDALVRADVVEAAAGCAVIVHAVNPPGYRGWAEQVLPMLDNTLAAARVEHATVVLPGTVYNFGPETFPVLREDAPQHPATRKGAIRVEMERRLEEACHAGIRALIVRAGDFFGPRSGNNWFSMGLVEPARPVTRIRCPWRPGIGHQWSYLPDVARTIVELLTRRDTLDAFARFHMAGHWDADGTQMTDAIRRVVVRRTGRTPRVSAFPWWLVTLASPFVTTLRELREMRYLWEVPLRMDNAELLATLGYEPHTPLETAVEATLDGMGNLDAVARRGTTAAA